MSPATMFSQGLPLYLRTWTTCLQMMMSWWVSWMRAQPSLSLRLCVLWTLSECAPASKTQLAGSRSSTSRLANAGQTS
ncbi:unnamed protein product [Polarella glacialis]|nr:unnamed protein product [Polarella glacialis]